MVRASPQEEGAESQPCPSQCWQLGEPHPRGRESTRPALTAAPLNGMTFSLSPGQLDRARWFVPSWHSSHPAPATSPATNQGLYQSLLAQQVHCHIRPVSGWRCWRWAHAHRQQGTGCRPCGTHSLSKGTEWPEAPQPAARMDTQLSCSSPSQQVLIISTLQERP